MEVKHRSPTNRKVVMLLAGDIGGTKTLLGIFDPASQRPTPVVVRSYGTLDFTDLVAMIGAFLDDGEVARAVPHGAIDRACFGVAGPVIDQSAALTNVPWRVEGRRIASEYHISHVKLLNDLQAMAYSVPELTENEVVSLQRGAAVPGGNMALIAAGTGLGEALLHNVDGRFVPSPSEAGHADFSARTEREIVLLRDLTMRHGRADIEGVVSGRGLLNIYRVSHSAPCEAGI
ncbi:MAG TPA: glucokinase, partial [Vicinamibacterales bacterium]|nr:glucokinase [Vicinamibacterales bacterium]